MSVKKEKRSTLVRILGYVGKYPIALTGSLVCAVISVIAMLFIPVLFGDAIDCIVEKGVQWQALKTIFIKTAVAAGVAALSQWLMSLCNNRISCNVVRDLRKDAFAKIGALPLKYVDGPYLTIL